MLARLKRRVLSHYSLLRRGLVVGFFLVVTSILVFLAWPLLRLSKEALFGPVNIFAVVFQKPQELKNDRGRTNILILGTGGPGHDGPNLTDMMMILSATQSGTINLIAIPRDIYLDSLGAKVNAAYDLGITKDPEVGLILAKAAVSEVTGLPIHYGVRIDFSVFENVIDLVGGVDVTIENSFVDTQYPIAGRENDLCDNDQEFKCRYETIQFTAGPAHLDGKTALKFVRSRHAEGDEGTDFARTKRQQVVVAALKNKIFSSSVLLSPSKILEIYSELKSHIDTDFDPNDASRFLKKIIAFRQAPLKNINLDLALLENPPVDERGWVLVPKSGDWGETHDYIRQQLE